MPPYNVNLWELPALLYRTKIFEMNRYVISHGKVDGILRVANIPTDILKVDKSKLPVGVSANVNNELIFGSTPVVTFANRAKKTTA